MATGLELNMLNPLPPGANGLHPGRPVRRHGDLVGMQFTSSPRTIRNASCDCSQVQAGTHQPAP